MQIKFNNKVQNTSAKTSTEFLQSQSQSDDDVWIVNGFATREPIALNPGDELFCIPRFSLPPREALEAMMSARHTPKVHSKLKNAFVAVCGLGGLGSNLALMLARCGLGKLLLIDFDVLSRAVLTARAILSRILASLKLRL